MGREDRELSYLQRLASSASGLISAPQSAGLNRTRTRSLDGYMPTISQGLATGMSSTPAVPVIFNYPFVWNVSSDKEALVSRKRAVSLQVTPYPSPSGETNQSVHSTLTVTAMRTHQIIMEIYQSLQPPPSPPRTLATRPTSESAPAATTRPASAARVPARWRTTATAGGAPCLTATSASGRGGRRWRRPAWAG